MAPGLFGRLQQELTARETVTGLTMADVLQLPPAERQLINWLIRTGDVSHAAVQTQVGDPAHAQRLLSTLIAKGFIRDYERAHEMHYQVRLAPRRQRELPANIWQALTDRLGKKTGE